MSYQNITNELNDMLSNFMDLCDLTYQEIEPRVLHIIKNNIKDINLIEHTLDILLNVPTEKGCTLFIKLCNYISKFNRQLADEYLEIYDDIYSEHHQKRKKYIQD